MRGKKAGVVLGYFSLLLQQSVTFFLTPFMLMVLGTSDFGVYRLMLSMGPFFALADLGLSNAIVRYVSEYRTKSDRSSESKFVALILLADMLAGLLIVIAGIALLWTIPEIFGGSLANTELRLLQKLTVFLIVNGVLNLFMNLTTGVMKSYNEFGLLRIFEIVRVLVRTALVVTILLAGYGVMAVVLVDTLMTGITLMMTAWYCGRRLSIHPSFRSVTASFAKGVFAYSAVVFVDVLAFQLFNSADAVIIGIAMSSAAVAVYSVGIQISSLFFILSSIMSDVLMPEVVERVTRNADGGQLTDYMVRAGRIKLLVLALPTIGFAFLGKTFVSLWVGDHHLNAFWVALVVIIPSMFSGLSDTGMHIMWAKNRAKVKAFASLLIALLNIVITIVLVRAMGILGAAIGTSIAWVGYVVFNGLYLHKVLELDMHRFYVETFRGVLPAIFLSAGASAVIAGGGATWSGLIMRAVAVCAIYGLTTGLLALNPSERLLVKNLLANRWTGP